MNEKIKNLYLESLDKNQNFYYQKFAELIIKECILTIQLKIIRNGYTPENNRSLMHVNDLAEKFGISLPLDYYGEFGVEE
jgi:hypothetical protein